MDTISVTCLIEGEHPFEDVVSDLINAIKVANPWTFVNVDDKELKLWKVDITFVGPNEKLKILENKECAVIKERLEGMRLFPFNKINEYFFEVSEKNHLSIIIERPPVIKSTSSLEVSPIVSLDCGHIQSNIKLKVLNNLLLPQDTKADNLKLRFSRENDKNSEELEFTDDQSFQEYLQFCVINSSFSLKVQVYTLQKAFSEWKLGTVCDLFELPSDFQEFSKFSCGIDSLEDSKAVKLLKHLYEDLKLCQKAIHGKLEATNSKFVEPFLVIATSIFDGKIKLYPEHNIQGTYGQGPLDFCLYLKGIIVGVVKVKKDNFDQDVAQTAMQLHCSLEEGSLIDWSGRLVAMEDGVHIILGQIVWLLKEAEKLIEVKLSKKRRQTNEEKDE
ncbi:hypothetical protein C2G38_2215952 [Gigaspora rosea]|uniref:Crinkler effector protein N-terminal domain-containing protein n=1 Tax=Gigaspora rosea TaxID=44941 RepID=A0A397UCU0_9GLOM|nr:hypothetical protein C2G38_2215952 [Gigaspora rosea]